MVGHWLWGLGDLGMDMLQRKGGEQDSDTALVMIPGSMAGDKTAQRTDRQTHNLCRS